MLPGSRKRTQMFVITSIHLFLRKICGEWLVWVKTFQIYCQHKLSLCWLNPHLFRESEHFALTKQLNNFNVSLFFVLPSRTNDVLEGTQSSFSPWARCRPAASDRLTLSASSQRLWPGHREHCPIRRPRPGRGSGFSTRLIPAALSWIMNPSHQSPVCSEPKDLICVCLMWTNTNTSLLIISCSSARNPLCLIVSVVYQQVLDAARCGLWHAHAATFCLHITLPPEEARDNQRAAEWADGRSRAKNADKTPLQNSVRCFLRYDSKGLKVLKERKKDVFLQHRRESLSVS